MGLTCFDVKVESILYEYEEQDNTMKVCHITTAHNNHDIRIFHKESVSLVKAGYDTYHIAQGQSREDSGVHVIGLGDTPNRRMVRMTTFAKRAYENAVILDCDIYHLHDPELLPYGLKLKKAGKKVVFDSHEDVPAQIIDKEWIPTLLRKLISRLYRAYETHVVKQLDAVVTATPHIAKQFENRAKRVVVVNNYPKLDDIEFHDTPFTEREAIACYAGGISAIRGEQVMLKAMEGVDGKLIMAGEHYETNGNKNLVARNIVYLGLCSRDEVNKLYGRSRIGLVLYQPAANHYEAQPIKMFEYMAAGLPVVVSNFTHWKEIVEESQCGICVDPTDAVEVRGAVEKLIYEPVFGQEMGLRARKAVEKKMNWTVEEKKLLDLYSAL